MRHVPHASPPATAALQRRGLRGRPGMPCSGLRPGIDCSRKRKKQGCVLVPQKLPPGTFCDHSEQPCPAGLSHLPHSLKGSHGKASAAPYGRSRLGISGVCDARLRPHPIGLRSGRTYAKLVRVCVCPRTERTRAADRPRQAMNGSPKPSVSALHPVKCFSCRIRQGRASSHCRNMLEV